MVTLCSMMVRAWFALAAAIVCGVLHSQEPVRPAITGIAFMRVYTTDAAAAQHFYGDTLGFERQQTRAKWIYPVNHSQWIEVLPETPPMANQRMAAIGFTTRDARALALYLKAHGVEIVEPLVNGEFSVRDPEGNLVVFVQAGSQRAIAAGHSAPAPHEARAASDRLIHVGFLVVDRAREDAFWRELLGFRPYWFGGQRADSDLDYVSLQVPDGTDWLEYMLNGRPGSDLRDHGGKDHLSLGVRTMKTAVEALAANHCAGANCAKTQMGRDGKVQLNLFDPDLTRVEFMEFEPSGPVCCSPFTGPHPK